MQRAVDHGQFKGPAFNGFLKAGLGLKERAGGVGKFRTAFLQEQTILFAPTVNQTEGGQQESDHQNPRPQGKGKVQG